MFDLTDITILLFLCKGYFFPFGLIYQFLNITHLEVKLQVKMWLKFLPHH